MNEWAWEDRQDEIDFIESGAEYEAGARFRFNDGEAQDDGLVTVRLTPDQFSLMRECLGLAEAATAQDEADYPQGSFGEFRARIIALRYEMAGIYLDNKRGGR